MAFEFLIWNQGNDGLTMGIRVRNVAELERLAASCIQPDLGGRWTNLADYLQSSNEALTEPEPYVRTVQVVWLNPLGYGSSQVFPGRTFVVTYTGPRRVGGGYASQGYCIVDPQGYPILSPHHQTLIRVEYIAHPSQDIIVVLP